MLFFDAIAVDHRLGADSFHHRFGYAVICLRPNVDNFVVFLTLSHKTGRKLPFDLTHLVISRTNNVLLVIGDNEVVNTNRRARACGEFKTGVHQLVSKDHGVFQTNATVALVDDQRDCLFNHWFVDETKRQTCRNHFPQQGATYGRVNNLSCICALTGHFIN